jgi:methyltransferase (TIGR00027 family)
MEKEEWTAHLHRLRLSIVCTGPHRILKRTNITNRTTILPPGYYPVIARTKYIDRICKEAIEEGIDQILIFGAGFDSRAVRFEKINRKTTIFELDSFHTQQAKIRQYKKKGIPLPGKTIYIPVDFNVDNIPDKILRKGFDPNKKTLFLLEGLIMYVNGEAVNELFTLVYELSSTESRVVFDYIYASVLRRENSYYGEKNMYDKVNSIKESWQFGIEKGEIEMFVNRFRFKLIQHLTSGDLERLYFTDNVNRCAGKVNGTHCIAYIKK